MNIADLKAWISTHYWKSEQVAAWVERHFIRRGVNAFVKDIEARQYRGKYSTGLDFAFYTGVDTELMANAYFDGSVYRRYVTGKASKITLGDDGQVRIFTTNTSAAADSEITDFTVRATIAPTGLLTVPGGLAIAHETLDAYDEGTWNPAITGSTGDPTVTYTTQAGKYTQIGNVLFYNANITINTYSGGTGDARFSMPSTVGTTVIGVARLNNVDVPGTPVDLTFTATGTVAWGTIQSTQDNGALQTLQTSGLSAGDSIRISGFYFVD
jgi:hypothetical protein